MTRFCLQEAQQTTENRATVAEAAVCIFFLFFLKREPMKTEVWRCTDGRLLLIWEFGGAGGRGRGGGRTIPQRKVEVLFWSLSYCVGQMLLCRFEKIRH